MKQFNKIQIQHFLTILLIFLVVVPGAKTFAQNELKLDTVFKNPYIDKEEWRDLPVRHKYLHGGFKGTDTKFSFYFPTNKTYKGRFFQYITPVPDSENLSQNSLGGEADKISFALTNGAYFIETNGGGNDAGQMSSDKTIGAYKANAAAAQYSKIKALELYGSHRTYGYAYGGSGGAYRTVGAIENTTGIWDGVVPYVLGSPMAIPNVFSVRMHAMRVLQDKFDEIADALEPGGSDNIYDGLNLEESAALKEVTSMGFPIKAWFNYKNMGIHAFPSIYEGMQMADGSYFSDFWTKPGYLGFDNPKSFDRDRIIQKVIIKEAISVRNAKEMNLNITDNPGNARGTADSAWKSQGQENEMVPIAFKINTVLPEMQFLGGDLKILSGLSQGKRIFVKSIDKDLILLGTADKSVVANIKPEDEVEIDNSNFLAAQTYHRHQVPGSEYPVWNQFKNADGKPIYPQRNMLLGPLFTQFTVGSLPSGKFNGKMILLESLWDTEAFPWQADWYYNQVKKQFGTNTNENFRLYFTDHANHADFPTPGDPTHIVSYIGVIQQALLDLSDWVEKGISPPASTSYKIVDGQVIVSQNANERKGIQPLVSLSSENTDHVIVTRGDKVNFSAEIQLPPTCGKIVSVLWDFEGKGTFDVASKIRTSKGKANTFYKEIHRFAKPGIYFVTVKVVTQKDDDTASPFTRIQNLSRMRVTVK